MLKVSSAKSVCFFFVCLFVPPLPPPMRKPFSPYCYSIVFDGIAKLLFPATSLRKKIHLNLSESSQVSITNFA